MTSCGGRPFGSGLTFFAATGACTSVSSKPPRTIGRSVELMRRTSFPVFDRELWLVLRNLVGDFQFQILRAHALSEIDRGAASVIAVHRSLAGEKCHQLVLADFQIAEVDLLHAALEQGVRLAGRVQIILYFLVVYFDGDRVQGEERPH